MFKIIFQY